MNDRPIDDREMPTEIDFGNVKLNKRELICRNY
jgi:hypothetical protein